MILVAQEKALWVEAEVIGKKCNVTFSYEEKIMLQFAKKRIDNDFGSDQSNE